MQRSLSLKMEDWIMCEDNKELCQYQSEDIKKDVVIRSLKENGFRITRQREVLIDIILGEPCACCKEIYILASKKEPGIGTATVYRTIDALERIGALKRKNTYELCDQDHRMKKRYLLELEEGQAIELDYQSLKKVLETGLKHCGYSNGKEIVDFKIK